MVKVTKFLGISGGKRHSCCFKRDLNYSKTYLKRPLKNRQNKDFMTKCSLMKVESIAECSAFCNTFDMH